MRTGCGEGGEGGYAGFPKSESGSLRVRPEPTHSFHMGILQIIISEKLVFVLFV